VLHLLQNLVKLKLHYADFATQVPNKVVDLSQTQVMKVCDTNHVVDFDDLCSRQSPQTLSPTFPVHCNGINSVRVIQTSWSWTCHGLCHKHLDMLRWFVSATFMICVHDFPRTKVSVKVGVKEFGLMGDINTGWAKK